MTKAARLRQQLESGAFLSAPGIYDMISAKIADGFGFPVLYMTGYGAVASALGLPDAGLASYREMVDCVARMAGATTTPLIADGDTGYGGLLNVRHAVRGYEDAGAAGIQLEDQEFPKKCGHTPGRRVVSLADMVKKVAVAVESRRSDDFVIVARTDARTTLGLDEAIARARAYGEAGADILFVESPESEDEMKRICDALDRPLLANMVEGGRTPVLPKERLAALGYRMAIFPGTGFLAAGAALRSVYQRLAGTGSSVGLEAPLYDFLEFSKLMGFEDIWEFEKAHAE